MVEVNICWHLFLHTHANRQRFPCYMFASVLQGISWPSHREIFHKLKLLPTTVVLCLCSLETRHVLILKIFFLEILKRDRQRQCAQTHIQTESGTQIRCFCNSQQQLTKQTLLCSCRAITKWNNFQAQEKG